MWFHLERVLTQITSDNEDWLEGLDETEVLDAKHKLKHAPEYCTNHWMAQQKIMAKRAATLRPSSSKGILSGKVPGIHLAKEFVGAPLASRSSSAKGDRRGCWRMN